jgi:hypothetical protein
VFFWSCDWTRADGSRGQVLAMVRRRSRLLPTQYGIYKGVVLTVLVVV